MTVVGHMALVLAQAGLLVAALRSGYPLLFLLSAASGLSICHARSRRVAVELGVLAVVGGLSACPRLVPLLSCRMTVLLGAALAQVYACVAAFALRGKLGAQDRKMARSVNVIAAATVLVAAYCALGPFRFLLGQWAPSLLAAMLLTVAALQLDAPLAWRAVSGREAVSLHTGNAGWVRYVVCGTIVVASFIAARGASQRAVKGVLALRARLGARDRREPPRRPSKPVQARPPSGLSRSRSVRWEERLDLNVPSVSQPHTPVVFLRCHDWQGAERLANQWVYVRTTGFDCYRNGVWTAASTIPQVVADADDGREDGIVTLRHLPAPIAYTMYCPELRPDLLPAVFKLASVRLPAVVRLGGERYAVGTGERWKAHFSYRFSMSSTPVLWRDVAVTRPTVGDVGALFVDVGRGPGVDRAAEQAGKVVGSAYASSDAVQQLLRHFRTSFEYRGSGSQQIDRLMADALTDFLSGSRTGNCELFASAFTLMARAAGVPARLAVGYCGGSYDHSRRLFTFHADDAHAWCEVYLARHGWVIVDPTPPKSPFAPGCPTPLPRHVPFEPGSYPELAALLAEGKTIRQAGGFAVDMPLNLELPPSILYAGGLVLLLAPLLVSLWQTRARPPESSFRLSNVPMQEGGPPFMLDFCRYFEQRGYPMSGGQTVGEYVSGLARHGLIGGEFDEMVEYVYRVCYAGGNRSADREQAFARLVACLEREERVSRLPT